MSLVIVGLGTTNTISQSETDSVSFLGVGTLDITGTQSNPINVTLSQVLGTGALDTINLSYANVTLGGVLGISALANYNIGAGSTLTIQSSIGISVGTTINFSAPDSHLVLASGVDLSLLSGISGFGPGRTIDVSQLATSVSYADRAGSNTGGTLTLLDSSGVAVDTLDLTSGDFVAGNFKLQADGSGGTLVDFATAFTSVVMTPNTADLGAGQVVGVLVTSTNPVAITGSGPVLTLNDGGTATYDRANSTATTMLFDYTVQPGQNTADLAITGANLAGSVVSDLAGATVDLSALVGNPAGTLQIDTTAPIVTSVMMLPGTGNLVAGQTVEIAVNASEAVSVTGGTPTLVLSDGGTATFDPTSSTAATLAFFHTVLPGQVSADLAVTGANLNGATVADGAGNALNLSASIGNPAGVLQVGTPASSDPTTGSSTNSNTGSNTSITPQTIDVYRFFDKNFGTHFYTSDQTERQNILQTRPDLVPEGVGLEAIAPSSGDPNATQVFRFFDTVHGTHFFTASTTERDSIIQTRSDLTYEPGSSFLEHAQAQPGDTAVYRFFDTTFGTHFYTASASERATILQTRSDLVDEGIGFYEPTRNPVV